MIYFTSDYCEGCIPEILEKLCDIQNEQNPGYGTDDHCANAARLIREACHAPDAAVHFLVGGTQTNLTVISAALRPYQAVIAADTGHISTHESGAIEATGHKVMALPASNGKIAAGQIRALFREHEADENREHTTMPAMVYLSHPTEYGTLYARQELAEISAVCREYGAYLFLDGARLGYGLATPGSDVDLKDLAELCDVFYIGGTKVGALFGEAVVVTNGTLKRDFRYLMKQRGAMLAKGWLLGIQFETLFEEDRYRSISANAITLADRMRGAFRELGFSSAVDSPTNQLFPILPDDLAEKIRPHYAFTPFGRWDDSHSICRFCTGWATKEESVNSFCADLKEFVK